MESPVKDGKAVAEEAPAPPQPAMEWPATPVNVREAMEIADGIVQAVTRHAQAGQDGLPWEDVPGVDTSRVLPGIKQWLLGNYSRSNVCVSYRSRETVGKEHSEYLNGGLSVCDAIWVAIAHLIYVESELRPLAQSLTATSAEMFSKEGTAAAVKDPTATAERHLFSSATLTPVLQGVIREWNRMDHSPEELNKGVNHNRLTWNRERLDMLRVACAITTVTHGLFRQVKFDQDGTDLMRFNHLCARLFYWTDLEDAVLGYKTMVTDAFQTKLEDAITKCKPQFYLWVRAQLQFDLERGREFGDVFRQVVYGFELGAGAILEYKRMYPSKSDDVIRDTQLTATFMDTDTDLMGMARVSTDRYNALRASFDTGLTEIAKRENENKPLHQALMLSMVAYFFEQVHRRKFCGRYCFFHYHLPDIYRNKKWFFSVNAFSVPPREKRPRIVCTGASVHVLFKGNWIPMKGGLVDACIAFFVLCRRFHANELETGVKISDMFRLISLDSLENIAYT